MYTGRGFQNFEIGDVDVVKNEGIYHLFHLTLPSHDYIAHAVSEDGFHWKRVKNALFISDPPAWDDDMLWTMHVTPSPYKSGIWRMFYTGICLEEQGRIQRVGLAHSDDLYHWRKVDEGRFPLEVSGQYYESTLEEGRHWVSFRDPFCFYDKGKVYLVAAARAKQGPVIRRGCVSLAEEVSENCFDFRKPLYYPMRYDDVEVPNIFKVGDRYYLIGSIREDIKVHYWYADRLEGPYKNFSDNVLVPQGNYAARVCWDEDRYVVWNFFYKGMKPRGEHLMAPPKEIAVDDDGHLKLKTFEGFHSLISKTLDVSQLIPLELMFRNPSAVSQKNTADSTCWFGCDSGFEAFLFKGEFQNFILSGTLSMEDRGKCGLVFRLNDEGDGYYLSLELFKGVAQLRAWRSNPGGDIEAAFHYQQLQAAFQVASPDPHPFTLIAYDQYIEFSLNGHILLTLADNQFEKGRLGFYVESAEIRVENLKLKTCYPSSSENYLSGLAESPI